MIATIRSELIKAVTVRSVPALAAAAPVAAVLLAAVFVLSLPVTQGRTVTEVPPPDVVGAALVGVDVAAVVLVVLGALIAGSEYPTGTIAPTFLLTPHRERVILAKAAVVVGIAVLVAITAATLCVAVGQAALLLAGLDLTPIDVRLLAGTAAGPVVYAVAGLAVAVTTRSTGGGVAGALALLLLPGVVGWVDALAVLAPLMPSAAVHGLAGVSTPGTAEHLAAAPAALLLVGWLTGPVGFAAWRAATRDA
ncbi:hypothetical protein ACQEVB_18625 [Pseudonocardia sp. CA-107938]|uniref:hypothetical protein n=1 Tax=Pseudonocardia sp. CA-107938 TaxID=3240021 RepID=UPI003D9298E1